MHDMLGILQYESKEMLKVFINEESYFTLDQLNDQIRDFDYGYYSDKNKPSPISKTLISNTNILKQKGTYCLFGKLMIIMITMMEMIKMIMIMIIKMIIIITKGTCGYDKSLTGVFCH